MPDEYEIKLPLEEEQSLEHCEAKNAKEFINEVKRRFIQDNRRDKNDDILRVLKDYKTPVLLRVNNVLPL